MVKLDYVQMEAYYYFRRRKHGKQMGVSFQRRQRKHEGAARGQGGEPGGDDEPWAACAAGIYDYDGGLHAVL